MILGVLQHSHRPEADNCPSQSHKGAPESPCLFLKTPLGYTLTNLPFETSFLRPFVSNVLYHRGGTVLGTAMNEWMNEKQTDGQIRHCLHAQEAECLLGDSITPQYSLQELFHIFSTVHIDSKSLHIQCLYSHPLFNLLSLLKSSSYSWMFPKFYTLMTHGSVKADWRCQ